MKKSICFFIVFFVLASFVSLNAQWSKTYGKSGTVDGDSASNIAPTSDGGFIVAGYSGFGGDFNNAMVVKYSSTGAIQWQYR